MGSDLSVHVSSYIYIHDEWSGNNLLRNIVDHQNLICDRGMKI